jgi:DNA damage-binding protein 1
MSWNYVVTAHKPSSVKFSLTGNFTGPDDRNLIIGKNNQLEIWTMTEEGIDPKHDVPIYGRIATMTLFRPPGEDQDILLITTEKYKMIMLQYNAKASQPIETRSTGDISDMIGRETENGQIVVVDPVCRCVAMHLYEGILKILPLDFNKRNEQKQAFNIRLEELNIFDIKLLAPKRVNTDTNPVVAILYQDSKGARHVKSYQVNIAQKELVEGPFQQPNVDAGSNQLIPIPTPIGGLVILGEENIVYHDAVSSFHAIEVSRPINIRAYGQVDPDGTRWLLADYSGRLFILQLELDNKREKVTKLNLNELGETCIPSTVSYCDAGFVFVGSTHGDSQLIKIQENSEPKIEEVFSYTNLGPIGDLCVVDIEKTQMSHGTGTGQCQVVTCSGGYKDGSLRVIRNGIGIEPLSMIDLAGIKGLWPLRPRFDSPYEEFIVIGFIGQTYVLGFGEDEESLGHFNIEGFVTDLQTICCETVIGDAFVQVTEQSVRLVDSESFKLISEWKPPSESPRIFIASANPSQIVLSVGEGRLIYLQIKDRALHQIKQVKLEHEVSCIDIHPLSGETSTDIVAVGMWTEISVRILSLPTLEPVLVEKLGGEILPRSVLFVSFENINYLLCALGDGHLFTFKLDSSDGIPKLTDRKKVSLGTKPITLSSFMSKDQQNVFACSDRPAVIYSQNHKLLFSNVNLKDVNHMCRFNSESFPDSLALALEGTGQLMIGSIDEIQKLHIRTIPLKQQPRRICYQESTNTFGVVTTRMTDDEGESNESNHVLLVDGQTFETIHDFKLDVREEGLSIASCNLNQKDYIVVGTGYVLPEEDEPTKGRILLFEIRDNGIQRILSLVAEKDIRGCAMDLEPFNGKLLVAVGGKIQLYRYGGEDEDDQNKELVLEYICKGSRVTTLTLQSRGDFILAGDMMKSISLLNYKPLDGTIEEIARDYSYTWLSATEIIDDDHFLAADSCYNLFTAQKNNEAVTDELKRQLVQVGKYHLGDFVNKFAHGSLVMNISAPPSTDKDGDQQLSTIDQESRAPPTIIYGTVSGAIGVIAQLSHETYLFMEKVQTAMREVIGGIGGLKHEEYRAYKTERRAEECTNFLDGDLIERFVDLNAEQKEQVVEKMRKLGDENLTCDGVSKRIEDLASQLH